VIFNRHLELEGRHAFLSPSKYSWINYDEEKLDKVYASHLEARRGTELHELAERCIKLGVRLPRTQQTLNMYVNDCIGWRMTPEVRLFYSENCFGQADAMGYTAGTKTLRVSDLKNGISPTTVHQLEVYVALFCLEYRCKPFEMSNIEMRIYQNDEVRLYDADPDEIFHIMDKIVTFDKRIDAIKREVLR
jgi:hypothetical protein